MIDSSDPFTIEIDELTKNFGNSPVSQVLRGVHLNVRRGHSMVIMGGSGSGKSVLLKNILGLMQPTAGSIKIDSIETTRLDTSARNELMKQFGMLFQGGALFDSLPVWENVAFRALNDRSLSRLDAYDLAVEKLRSVGLAPRVADLFPAELSGGMQKRVSLARSIASNPKIIFFDEPTTGLDPIMADVINDLIVKCVKELGATAVSITHDMASLRKIADDVAMLYQGKIIWSGPVQDLDQSGNPHVDQFINGRADGPIQMVA